MLPPGGVVVVESPGGVMAGLLPLFEQALQCFAEAEKIRPPGNDDAILRWNRCVRLLQNQRYGWEEELASFDASDTSPI